MGGIHASNGEGLCGYRGRQWYGSGINLASIKKGARVAALDINEATLKETETLAGENRSNLSLHVVNIADRDAVTALPEAVIQIHGSVDGLINNAGIIQKFVKINELEFKDIERVINVKFLGCRQYDQGLSTLFTQTAGSAYR